MTTDFVTRAKAAEFDITTLGQAGGRSGLVCLSESTWELAYSLVTFYGYWRSRYYFTDPATGDRRTLTDDEYTLVTDMVDLAIEELRVTGCEELTEAINNIVAQLELSNDKMDTLNANLTGIQASIDALAAAQTPAADVDDLEEILDSINVILGAAAILP